MKRFVSYLYSIYNNQKIHNAGFARVELRTGRNRIDIHLRENGYSGKTGTVYLFIKKQENIQGISIGDITFHNNQADFRYEQADEKIGQTSWQIMQMQGILIRIDEQTAFLSQWDEEPIDASRFEIWEGAGAGQEASKNEDIAKSEDISENEVSKNEKISKNEDISKKEGSLPQAGPSADTQTDAGHEQRLNTNHSAADSSNKAFGKTMGGRGQRMGMYRKPPGMQSETGNFESPGVQNEAAENSAGSSSWIDASYENSGVQAGGPPLSSETSAAMNQELSAGGQAGGPPLSSETEGAAEGFESRPSDIQTAELQPQVQPRAMQWEQTWRYMLRMYPVMKQFEEKDDVLCVRIEIKDVRLLPEKYWSVINNSFLLHGFFNYRYLVFGRMGRTWFIGVPGIYQNQEHVMASIFGFPDFLPQMRKNEQGEQPGYWYRILDI